MKTQPNMHLHAYASALATVSQDGQRPITLVCGIAWMCDIGNRTLAETIDTFGGRKTDGQLLKNREAWGALRAAARLHGGLQCDGGPIVFEPPQGIHDERFLKIATSAAHDALRKRAAEIALRA